MIGTMSGSIGNVLESQRVTLKLRELLNVSSGSALTRDGEMRGQMEGLKKMSSLWECWKGWK